MLPKAALLACLGLAPVGCTSLPDESRILNAGGRGEKTIVEKARSTLAHQQVFASRHVGYGGQPTSGCWALTVLVRHDPHAKETFTDICRLSENPAAKLYALAGLMALDPQHNPDLASLRLDAVANQRVECLSGCDGEIIPIPRAISKLRRTGPSPYLYTDLPPLYETIDCRPFSY